MLGGEVFMKKILVTGSAGFIGSHVCEQLVRKGYGVRAFYRYNSSNYRGWLSSIDPKVAASIEYAAGDLRDFESVNRAAKGVDGILHLGALIAIPYSYDAPRSYIDTNVLGTLNVIQAALANGGSRVIQTSTSEVYGSAQTIPITENHPLNAQSPYAASKIGADQLFLSSCKSFGLQGIVLRPFNTFGPRQSPRAVISTIILQLLSGARELSLGTIKTTRDFTYATDTAEGFVRALEATSVNGDTIQLGTGYEVSIETLAKEISAIIGVPLAIKSSAEKMRPEHSEVTRLISDPSKAQKLLGWKPEFAGEAGLRKGLELSVEWFRANQHAFPELDQR
jgi:dTDP-glucose 4,6-dehydratase